MICRVRAFSRSFTAARRCKSTVRHYIFKTWLEKNTKTLIAWSEGGFNLLRAADFLPSANVLGALVMGLDPRFRRLGDLVAGTIVIVEGKEPMLPPIQLSPAATPEELGALPAHVPFTPEERDAIDHLMRRKGSLSPARATELASLLAPVLARRLRLTYTDPVRFLGLLHQRATLARGS